MLEIVKLNDQLSNILNPYLEPMTQNTINAEVQFDQCSKSNGNSSITRAFYNDYGILWIEEASLPSFEEFQKKDTLDLRTYEINWLGFPSDVQDKLSYWDMQVKYKHYKKIYYGIKGGKQAFCLIDKHALIYDESVAFLYDLKNDTIEKFKIPREIKGHISHMKVKAFLMTCKVKFLLFKYKNEGRKAISLLAFTLTAGKIKFYTPIVQLNFDPRLRWRKFYNPSNQAIIVGSYIFFNSENILFIFDKKEGTLVQTIPIEFGHSPEVASARMSFQLFNKKFLFMEKSSGQKYFIQEKNKDFSQLSNVLALQEEIRPQMSLIERLLSLNTMSSEQKEVLYREIGSKWMLNLALIPASEIAKLDKSSQRVILYIIKSNLNDCETEDFLRYSIHFLLKYDDIQLLRLFKVLQFIETEEMTYCKASPKLFKLVINKLSFITPLKQESIDQERAKEFKDVDRDLLKEFEIEEREWSYKAFLKKLLTIISKEGEENNLIPKVINLK